MFNLNKAFVLIQQFSFSNNPFYRLLSGLNSHNFRESVRHRKQLNF